MQKDKVNHLKLHRNPWQTMPAYCILSESQRWAPALFSRFRAREREGKIRARKRKEKKSVKKSKSAEREFALFLPPTVEIRF
jgi:hypothetical protein